VIGPDRAAAVPAPESVALHFDRRQGTFRRSLQQCRHREFSVGVVKHHHAIVDRRKSGVGDVGDHASGVTEPSLHKSPEVRQIAAAPSCSSGIAPVRSTVSATPRMLRWVCWLARVSRSEAWAAVR